MGVAEGVIPWLPRLSWRTQHRHFLPTDKRFYILGADDFYVMTQFLKLTLPVKCACGCFYADQTRRNIRHSWSNSFRPAHLE